MRFPISSNRFTYSKGTFVSEFSSIPDLVYRFIYDDAYDVGFCIMSEKTGKLEYFYFSEEIRNNEGELMAHVFVPVNREIREAGINVKIFNT